jgi:hypothetical protein
LRNAGADAYIAFDRNGAEMPFQGHMIGATLWSQLPAFFHD